MHTQGAHGVCYPHDTEWGVSTHQMFVLVPIAISEHYYYFFFSIGKALFSLLFTGRSLLNINDAAPTIEFPSCSSVVELQKVYLGSEIFFLEIS